MRLRQWDYVHSPPGTAHVLLAREGERALVLAVGARGRGKGGVVYPVDETAARYGACAGQETSSVAEAYAPFLAGLPRSRFAPYREGRLPPP